MADRFFATNDAVLTDDERRWLDEDVSEKIGPVSAERVRRLLASEAHWKARAEQLQRDFDLVYEANANWCARAERAEAALREIESLLERSEDSTSALTARDWDRLRTVWPPPVVEFRKLMEVASRCERAEADAKQSLEEARTVLATTERERVTAVNALERAEAALRRLIAAAEHCWVNNTVVAWSELGDALDEARALSEARPAND
ncbi:MAG TPA: hypothetical protein VFH51_14740 [Myxococcota bacterium]|nr:hypothetical protein [Myxococcota bacterium]